MSLLCFFLFVHNDCESAFIRFFYSYFRVVFQLCNSFSFFDIVRVDIVIFTVVYKLEPHSSSEIIEFFKELSS